MSLCDAGGELASDAEPASVYNSAAAFVASGVQDSNEDTCSICLEVFTVEEPCTVWLS